MFNRILSWLKPLLGALLLIAVLQATGLMSSVSFYAQSALLKTGVRNASARALRDPEAFDFKFTLRSATGERVPFEKYKGKVVFLNLWATWCGPCRVEMPSIQELYSAMDTTQVKFVMLSIDLMENHAKVVKYVNDKKFTFPVYHQTLEYLPKQLQVGSIPTTFILGADGKIKAKKVGTTNFNTDEFKEYLKQLAGGA